MSLADTRVDARTVFLLAICLACRGNGVRGEYKSDDGTVFNFKPNGKVEVTMSAFGMRGATQEMDYAVEDGKIMLGAAGQPRIVMPIEEDGCFVFNAGLMGGKMCKSDSKDGKQKASVSDSTKTLAERDSRLKGGYPSQDGSLDASSDLSKSYISVMQSDLRNLMTYEEQYAIDKGGAYFGGTATAAAPLQGFTPSQNVTIVVTSASGPPPSWRATATHSQITKICNLTVGVITCR